MKLLEEFRRYCERPRPNEGNDVAGYYASLAAEGIHGEDAGDDMAVIVRANVASVQERIRTHDGTDAQAIGDACLAMFLFGVQIGRRMPESAP